MRRACVTMRGTRVGRQCWCVETGSNRARPRPSTDAHLHITHEPRTYHIYHRTKVLVRGTFAKRACLDSLRQWFMRRACIECSWNTQRISSYALKCAIFLPPKSCSMSRRTSTHKPNLCVVCAWFVRDRLCDWPLTNVSGNLSFMNTW